MSNKTNHKKIKLPKLPAGSYKLPAKKFLKIVHDYPMEVKNALIRHYNFLKKQRKALKLKKIKYGRKLNDIQRATIIELAGRFYTAVQIIKVIREDWGIEYTNGALNKLLRNNRDIIANKRLQYTNNIDSLRLVHERPRIEELTEIFESAKRDGQKKYQIDALKEIRNEVKVDRLILDANITGDVNLTVKEHLYKQVDINMVPQLALLKILQKHKLDFMQFAHRLQLDIVKTDPNTGQLLNKRIPAKVDNVEILSEKLVEEKRKNEEKKIKTDPKIIKRALLLKLKKKTKEIEKVRNEVKKKSEKIKNED